jgi:hypothetical protein
VVSRNCSAKLIEHASVVFCVAFCAQVRALLKVCVICLIEDGVAAAAVVA